MSYPRAIKPNYGLDQVNVKALDLGAPALADDDRYVVSTNMIVGAYTLANPTSVDALPRNVTVTATAAGAADTAGTITVSGRAADDDLISEVIIPVAGTTVAGLKAFKTVTGIVGAGWVIGAGNDTIVIGTGTLVGLPAEILAGASPLSAAYQVFSASLGGAAVTPVVVWDADEIEKNTVDASAGTYNGTKHLVVLTYR